ncbi:MAG: carboxypeptidase-like regulatory domain-containing protein, partial [Chitinophagaceae bacterium]|nr:carboxypeptidase-like regulatory domain-containing protein [Chitinophagaceae bacterium]
MRKPLLLFITVFIVSFSWAGRISGKITDNQGKPLPFASVLVKGTTKGTTANNEGNYFLELDPGKYVIAAQYVGYDRIEKNITVSLSAETLNFQLSLQQLSLKEVVVRPGGEDPAYEIIRNAIRKRPSYENPLDSFTCEAYIKTLIKTRKLPTRIFGQKIEQDDKKDMGVDSAGKGIVYLSESLTRIAFKKPGKTKLEVLSGRESGSNGYGFNFPTFINFYSNNVVVFTSQLNPRGFVSPIADGALNFYRYRYLGSFFEDGKEINQIRVTAKRKFEPVFSGIINITDGDWRIHSLDLLVTKDAQLEIMDSLTIKQIHVPVSADVWQTKDQVILFTFKKFGIEATGNFLNVYNKYDINPGFRKKYFNNVVVQYDTTVNKKGKEYWDSIRPVQLEPEEANDYKVKDSVYEAGHDSAFSKRNIDSLKKKQGRITIKKVFWSGFNRSNFDPIAPTTVSWQPLLRNVQYNTVEGVVARLSLTVTKTLPKWKEQLSITPQLRYGFSNTHFNPQLQVSLSKRAFSYDSEGGSSSRRTLSLFGGKRVSQFNRDNPITPLMNGLYTLLARKNYMK